MHVKRTKFRGTNLVKFRGTIIFFGKYQLLLKEKMVINILMDSTSEQSFAIFLDSMLEIVKGDA